MKRWTMAQDLHVAQYYDTVGSYPIAIDLGRSSICIKDRVRKLKRTGAWQALHDFLRSETELRKSYRAALGISPDEIESFMIDAVAA
jgi:hypothetical protein